MIEESGYRVQRLILVRNEENGLEVKNAVDLGTEKIQFNRLVLVNNSHTKFAMEIKI
jgi:hypothetical protein